MHQQATENEGSGGDLFQLNFRVKRGEGLLGRFSRRTVDENRKAGLFREDDLYWSENRLEWRSLGTLQHDDTDARITAEVDVHNELI